MADTKTDEIRNFVVGPIQTNCYAYVSGGACMVVDPGAAGAAVAEHLADVRVECVVATHGHGDHVGGVSALVAACEAPFCINAADAERAMHAGEPSELGIAYDDDAPAPDRELSEGADHQEREDATHRVGEGQRGPALRQAAPGAQEQAGADHAA